MVLSTEQQGDVISSLLSMFVSPTDAPSGAAGASVHQEPRQQSAARQSRDGHSSAVSKVTVGYKVTPINLVNGQALAEPQVLAGTAALALHGLLMKLHAQNMQERLVSQSLIDMDTAAQQSAAVSPTAQQPAAPSSTFAATRPGKHHAAGAGHAAAVAGAGGGASGHAQQPGLDGLPAEVLKLLPKELLEQGPEVLKQQLEEYLHLRQQLASHEQAGQLEQQESYRGAAEVCSQLAGTPTAARAGHKRQRQGDCEQLMQRHGSGGSSTSCTDPLEASPEQHDQQLLGTSTFRAANSNGQQWGWRENSPAAAAVVGYISMMPQQDLNGVSGFHQEQHVPYKPNTARGTSATTQQHQHLQQRHTDDLAAGAAVDSSATHKPRRGQYRGVRLRPWGTYGAEIRDPATGTRVWLGSFDNAEEAALTYDAAVRELRGPKGVTNLPEPPEPERSKYQAKVRELLNRAQAKPGARQPALQPQGLQTQQLQHAQLQQLGGHEQVNPGVDELSMQQQLLREQYQQPEYWRQQDEHDPRYSSSPADITSAPPDVMGGDFQDHLEDQPQQQEQQEDEQAARDSVPPPDLGLYDQQAQQLAEELRRLQDAMLGQPAAAADGTGAAAAGFDPGLTSPAGAAATAALLQLQGGVAVKAELW